MDALYVARNLSSSSTMDRFNLNKYRQRNPQSSTIGGSRSGSSVPHAESQPVASTSKLPPLQNGQSVPPFQQHPSGKNRVEPPQTRVSSSHHASTLSHQQFDDPYTQKATTSALPQQPYRMPADGVNAYAQLQLQQLQQQQQQQQQELQRLRHAEVQQGQLHYRQQYLPQSQQQLYHQQLQQQLLHQEQPHRRPSSSGDALVAHTHPLTSAPLDSSSDTLVASSSSTFASSNPSMLTTSPTVMVSPNPDVNANPSANPSQIAAATFVLQLSELVAKKVFETMERAGTISAGVNGKGKERAADSSDAHTPLTAPPQPGQPQSSYEQPNNTHMMLLVQVIKEMKEDVKGIKDVLVGCEESDNGVGGVEEGGREKGGVIVLDHSDEEDDSGAAPTLGAWRTRLDKKRKDRRSNKRVQKASKEPRGMLQRLESLEMDVQELLERLRDPLAGFDGEGAFVGTGRRQQEGLGDRMLQPQAQAQREPSRARAVESPTQQNQQPTIIDLTTSPSRDGTEGVGDSGMLIDADENVRQVDENEKARTIGQDDQAMDMVGDKSDDVGVGVGRMMQVDEEATTPNAQGEADDVFGPLTPNSLDVSKTARSEVLSVGNAAAGESPAGVRETTSATIKPAPRKSKLDSRVFFGAPRELASLGREEQGSHSSEPTPSSASEAAEATKLKIRLSPKVTLVVGSPPHRHTSDPMDVEPTTTTTAEAEEVSTSTPPRPVPSARSATPPPGFSPVDWSKVSDASRSRSGSAGAGVMSMNAKRSLRSTSSSLSPSLLSLSMNPMKTAPLEVRKFAAECFTSDSAPGTSSYPLRRPSEDSIAALRMEVRQSPRVSPGMIVLEGSTSVGEVRKRGGTSPLGMSRSASETSPPPPLPSSRPSPTTKVQVPVAPEMGATVSSVLTPLSATRARTEAFSSPKVAPSTSLMSVDSPSQPAQTFGDAEDVPSPSPALALRPLSSRVPLPSDSSSSSSSSPPNLPLSRHVSVVSVEEERDVGKKPEAGDGLPSGRFKFDLSRWKSLVMAGYLEDSEEEVGEGEGGVGREDDDDEDEGKEEDEEDEAQDVRHDEEEEKEEEEEGASMQLDEEKSTVVVGDEHQKEVEDDEEEEGSMLLDEEEGTVGADDEPQEDDEEEEKEEESVFRRLRSRPQPKVVADDRTTDEYEDEEEEEPSVEQTDEGGEGSLSEEEEEELQREVDELQEGADEDEEEVVSPPLSPAQVASSSPSASQSASQAEFRSSSPYASSGVSSITINLHEVDLGKVRFGPPKKVPKGSTPELSQGTTATVDSEAVVQSLVMEDIDSDDAGDARLATIDNELRVSARLAAIEAVLRAYSPNSTPVVPAEPNSEEEADNLGRSFEGGIPADGIDDNENDQEDSNLDHTFENGIPADEHASASPPAVSPRQQTKSSGRARLTPVTMTADPKTPQKSKSPGYIYVPSRSSSPVKKTSQVVGNGKGKETEKVKMETRPVKSIDLSDDDEIIFTGRSRRGKPPATRPILTKPPMKLELFDGPGPIETSTPVQQDVPLPPLPLSSVRDALLNSEPPKTPKRVVDPQPLRDLSPLSDLTPSPKLPMRELPDSDSADELDYESPPPFDAKKHAARVDDDDDTEIRPIKKKRKASAATSVATTAGAGSAMNMKLDPDQSSEATANAPPAKKRLLVMPKKGQSMAVTRVKKRKAIPKPDDEDEEPPLKKAKLRRSTRSSETSSVSRESSKSKEKGKTRERPVRTSARITPSPAKNSRSSKDVKMENSSAKKISTRRPRGSTKKVTVVWPTCSNPNYDQHLQCDICHDWYHIGCVGVAVDDIRLDETEIYTCPRCDCDPQEETSPSKRKKSATANSPTSKCARPDCQVNTEPDDVFEVEAIVGMSGSGTSALCLVKWQNYGFDEVTRQTLESMQLSDPRILLETFYKAAKAEGLDLKTRKNEYVVLKAAAAAGWNTHGEFVKAES